MGLYDDIKRGAGALLGAVGTVLDPPLVRGTVDQSDVPFSSMHDLLVKGGLAEPTEEKPRAMFHDPYAVMDFGGWRERPSALTYETLRMMSSKNTVIAAVIQTRCNQVAQFARPQQGPYDKGYRVILRNRRDKKRTMTPVEKKRAEELERMLETTGYLLPDEKAADRDSFRDFLKKGVRDILTYDQWCFEKQRDRRGKVSRFIALPSESIRPAAADIEHMEVAEVRERVSHVQVYEDTVISEFVPDDISWGVMNPRSDLRANGFGFSPIEMLINLVTAWLYGFDYNQRFFMQGSAIKGLLNVKGSVPDRQLRAFRRMWYSMVSGVTNAWKTPILNAEGIEWVPMHSTNREMEFAAWMDWLTKLTCAIYGIDPVEINFIFGGGGTNSGGSMFDRRPNQKEVQESKDKGLVPLMDFISDKMNAHVIWELEDDFEFAFTGLDAAAEEKELNARVQMGKSFKTINEIRALYEDEPLEENGDIILDSVYAQMAAAAQAQQQQPEKLSTEEPQEGEDEGEGEAEGPSEGQESGPAQQGPGGPVSPAEGEEALQASAYLDRFARGELRKAARVYSRVESGREIIDIDLPED